MEGRFRQEGKRIMAKRKIVIVSSRMPASVQKRIRATLQKGELTKHGYSMYAPASQRHKALEKSIREDGARTVFRRLMLLYVWNKNDDPHLAKIAREDAEWVAKNYKNPDKWGNLRFVS